MSKPAFHKDSLPRFLIRHAIVGKLAGLILTGLLIWLNVGGLGDLIYNARDGLLAVIILTIAMMGLMSSLSMATGVYLFYSQSDTDSSASDP